MKYVMFVLLYTVLAAGVAVCTDGPTLAEGIAEQWRESP